MFTTVGITPYDGKGFESLQAQANDKLFGNYFPVYDFNGSYSTGEWILADSENKYHLCVKSLEDAFPEYIQMSGLTDYYNAPTLSVTTDNNETITWNFPDTITLRRKESIDTIINNFENPVFNPITYVSTEDSLYKDCPQEIKEMHEVDFGDRKYLSVILR